MLVAITCTKKDFLLYQRSLFKSLNNFMVSFGDSVFFIIVFQDKDRNSFNYFGTFLKSFPEKSYFFKEVGYLSVSRARNDAIKYAKLNGFNRFIFHDVSLVYTLDYLNWVKRQSSSNLLSGSYEFTDDLDSPGTNESSSIVEFNSFRDNFVCSYVFPLNAKLPSFDERFGPGESSVFTSGEDFLFLRRFFQLNSDMHSFLRFRGIGILHPPRPTDYSKHLAYAKGQGKIHQIYLLEEKSLYAVWRCVLFFGNALCRTLLLKRNWLKILSLRLKGFFDTNVKV